MKPLIRRITGRLKSASPLWITLLAIGYEFVLGLLDYATPEEMSFTIFYLLGVAFVGWGAGRRSAILVSAVSTAIMVSHERSLAEASSAGIVAWNASTRFLLFCAVGWLTAEITRLNRHLQRLVEARTTQLRAETQKHKATSAKLSEALSRQQTIIGNLPMVIFAVDRNGVITFEDGRALQALGVKPGEHIGQSVLEAFQQSKEISLHMERALRGEEFSAPVEVGPVALETWYSPTREKDGSISGYTGVAMNVSGQRRLERQILEISDREQARLGQEIHDGLCQQLVSLAFDANALEQALAQQARPEAKTAARIAQFLDQAITESRQLARGLFPIRLEGRGLRSALQELARSTCRRFGIDCRFESDETAATASKTTATHLYRIAQEAIMNAVKHGRAATITLRLTGQAGQLKLQIVDDGLGIGHNKPAEGGGMGLHIMDYRARSIGGSFSFNQRPRGGMAVCCCVPGQAAKP